MPLDAVCAADHQNRIVQNLQGSLHLRRKIHMPRRIQEGEFTFIKLQHCLFGKNRNSPGTLHSIVIQKRIFIIHTPQIPDTAAYIEHPFGQGSFPGVYMGKQTNGKFFHSMFSHFLNYFSNILSPLYSRRKQYGLILTSIILASFLFTRSKKPPKFCRKPFTRIAIPDNTYSSDDFLLLSPTREENRPLSRQDTSPGSLPHHLLRQSFPPFDSAAPANLHGKA